MQRLVIEAREDGLVTVQREYIGYSLLKTFRGVGYNPEKWMVRERYLTTTENVAAFEAVPSKLADSIDVLGLLVNWDGRREHPDCECSAKPDACPVHGDQAYRELTTRH